MTRLWMAPWRGFDIDFIKLKNSESRSQKPEEYECRFAPAIIMARAEGEHLILNPDSWLLDSIPKYSWLSQLTLTWPRGPGFQSWIKNCPSSSLPANGRFCLWACLLSSRRKGDDYLRHLRSKFSPVFIPAKLKRFDIGATVFIFVKL